MRSRLAICALLISPLLGSAAAAQEHPGIGPYKQVCQMCHGERGTGDIAPALVPFAYDADYVLAVVREGYGQMPPISTRELTDDQVRHVVGYLELLTAEAAGVEATSRIKSSDPAVDADMSGID